MSSAVMIFLMGPFSNKIVSNCFQELEVEGCPGHSPVQLWRISWGEGRVGPIGVDLGVWRRWYIEIPEVLVVVREVLIVLILRCMNPLNLE